MSCATAVPQLTDGYATKRQHSHEFLRFTCWNGDPDEEEYAAEAEDYIRRRALGSTYKTLAFRDRSELVGVTAFDKLAVRPHQAARYTERGWKLQVLGITTPYQGTTVSSTLPGCPSEMRIAEYVLRKTYSRMLELDPSRRFVRAVVHDDNVRSWRACARVELERREREDLTYWRMLGPVDPQVGYG
jgi:hypothetical protein